jgi:hypothetical protein
VRTTVYATLEDGHWVLASALPRKPARWSQTTVARIRYVVEAGLVFDLAQYRICHLGVSYSF